MIEDNFKQAMVDFLNRSEKDDLIELFMETFSMPTIEKIMEAAEMVIEGYKDI